MGSSLDILNNTKSFTGIKKISLDSFRNHKYFNLDISSAIIALVGINGTGKTSVLEAISTMSPGKGLKNASYKEMVNLQDTKFEIKTSIKDCDNLEHEVINSYSKIEEKKSFILNGKVSSPSKLIKNNVIFLWIDPSMDRIFSKAPSSRRQFFDRIVNAFDNNHASRINSYERLLKERSRVLKESPDEIDWLDALEHKMANYAVAIAASRVDVIIRIKEFLNHPIGVFPKVDIKFNKSVENMLEKNPAIVVENKLKEKWLSSRNIDSIVGGSCEGIHRSDYLVLSKHNGVFPASSCSSGEQKALLISITLSASRAIKKFNCKPPILLLDEVFSHLDDLKKKSLAKEIYQLGMQTWITGTEKEEFMNFNTQCDIYNFDKNNGKIR